MSSTTPESWRSSGMTPTPAAAIAPARPGRHGIASTRMTPPSRSSRLDSSVGERALPVALDAGDADDLARRGRGGSGRRAASGRRLVRTVSPSAASDHGGEFGGGVGHLGTFERGRRRGRAPTRSERSDTSRPTMRGRQRGDVDVAGRDVVDHTTLAHDRDVVGRLHDLVELVADEHNGSSFLDDARRAASRRAVRLSAGVSTDVGSSKIRIDGSRRRHLMISTRWRMPTGRSPTTRVRIDVEPVALADLARRGRGRPPGGAGPRRRARRSPRRAAVRRG